MKMSKKLWLLAGGMLFFLGSMGAFQRSFREYPGIEYNDFPVPPDYQHPLRIYVRAVDVSALYRPRRLCRFR